MAELILIATAGAGIGPLLVAVSGTLTTIYIVCLIIGGGLILVSTILGSHSHADMDADVDAGFGLDVDADVDADLGLDVDADVDVGVDVDAPADMDAPHVEAAHDGLSLTSWFSIRFLVYFVAVFGAVGTVLTYTTSATAAVVFLIAFGSGLAVGQGVHQTLRYIQRTSGDSTTTVQDFVTKSARVTVRIRPGQRGEVGLQVRGRERYVAAVAKRADDEFQVGDRVGVVTFANGLAEVVSQREFEFLTDTDSERGEEL